MPAEIIDRTETGFTLQITVRYNSSMLGFEEALQNELNEAGVLATQEAPSSSTQMGHRSSWAR